MSRAAGDLIEKKQAADGPEGFDWSAWLLELGASVEIATSSWSVSGSDAVLTTHDPSTILVSGLKYKTQVYLAAGTLGVRYTVTNHIVTNSSPPVTDERSFEVLVQN